jgi:hypothetical protein
MVVDFVWLSRKRQRNGTDSERDMRRFLLVLVVLALLGGLAALALAVRNVRERASLGIPHVSGLKTNSFGRVGYEVTASGHPQWQVERELREFLASLAVRAPKDAPIGLRIVANPPHACRITGEVLQALDNFEGNLEGLSLATVEVTPSALHCIGQMHSLRYLKLTITEIGDPELLELSRLIGLRVLDVSVNKVPWAGIEALRAALPDCTISVTQ